MTDYQQQNLTLVRILTEPLSYIISSYRISIFEYLSNKYESYRINLKIK